MANIVDADHYRRMRAAHNAGGSGGNMDDVLRRLGILESHVGELRADVRAITATLPHLATKSEISDVRADIHALEAKMLRWMIGTMIGISSVTFTVAKFVN